MSGNQQRTPNKSSTYNKYQVRITCLHPGCRGRVFVASKVLCIDHSNNCIQLEVVIRFTFQFSNLECEGSRKGRSPEINKLEVLSTSRCTYEHSMKMRSGRNLSNDTVSNNFLDV